MTVRRSCGDQVQQISSLQMASRVGDTASRTWFPSRIFRAAGILQVHTGMWRNTEGLIGVRGHALELGLFFMHMLHLTMNSRPLSHG